MWNTEAKVCNSKQQAQNAECHHFLLHNKVRPHSDAQTQDLITSYKWEKMDHTLYTRFGATWLSPLPTPKEVVGSKRFDDDDDLKGAVQKRLTLQAATFYEKGIQKLVPRYDNCLDNGSEYVEK